MKRRTRIGLVLELSAIFYLFFCIRYGVQLRSDSNSYIRMISAREPVYPLFLQLFRSLFGEAHYLVVVAVAQNLLMAAAVTLYVFYTQRLLRLPEQSVWVMVLIHFGVEILCQYFSERAGTYPSSILTEGICLSLWLVWLRLALGAVCEGKWRDLLLALLLAAVLTDTRKQMAVAYPILLGGTLLCRLGKDRLPDYGKRLLLTAAGCVLSILLALLGTRLYNYVLRGSFAQNTRDMNLVLTTTLYAADPEDAELIEEPEVRELFVWTMEQLEESKSNYRYAGAGWRALEEHYEEHYDLITVDTTKQGYLDAAIRRGFAEGMEAEQEADRMSGVIIRALFWDNLGTYLRIYLASVRNGLVNTVAARGTLLELYALLAYLVYAVLLVICLRRSESRVTGRYALLILLAILCNVGVAAALIFCQSRYMIYNMAPFYTAGLAMLLTLLPRRRAEG